MYTMPAPTVRLLLLKSGAGSGAKIANMPGFAFWGGRWHKVAHDKPAPKHAPLAHHPKAAGHFEPVAHLTQDQWDALKLPESNTNAPTFNKQLQTVKELSESGNVTALLGLGVGSNTYGVKLSKIINHLLGLHGSPHAVSPGQKPGTHAATLNADPAAPHPSGLPDHIAPKADSSDPAVNAASQTVTKNQASGVLDNLPGSTNFFSDGASIEGVFQKAEKSHNELLVQHESGVPSVVDVDLDQIVITQPLIQKNKVLAYFDKSTTPPPVPGVVTDGGKVAIVDGHHRLMAAKLKGQKSIKVSLVTPPASSNNDKAELGKLEAAQAGGTEAAPAAGPLTMPDFEEGKTTTGVKDYYQHFAQQVIDHGHAGNVSVLENMKKYGSMPNAKGKVSNTWAGKTANSKKLLALHAAALAHAGGGAPAVAPEPVVPSAQPEPTAPRLVLPKKASAVPAAAAPEPTPKEGDTKPGAEGGTLVLKDGHWVKQGGDAATVAPATQAAPTPTTSPLTAEQLANLQSIPWYKLKLPDSNSNAKSHNAAVAKIEAMTFAGDVAGLKAFADKKAGAKQAYAKKQHLLAMSALDFLNGSGPTAEQKVRAKAVAEPAAAPTPAPAAPTTPPTVNGLPSMDNWVKTGPQGGSNPGGKFKDPSGQEWYCKFPKDSDTAKSEVLAAKLYALAGLSAQDCMLVTRNGEVGIASKWVDLKKADNPKSLAKIPGVLNGFAVDAWLCNRDVVGESLDNLLIGSDGSAHRVDAGGSLEYRAQGGFKVGLVSAPPFGPSVVEIDRMRDPFWNKKAAAVFGGMTDADITASVAKVLAISDVAIRAMVNQHGPGDEAAKKKMAETLIARKQDLLKRYPEAAKKKKAPTFKPEEISAPPSFLNWGGSGKSGPSSKEFLNKANEDAVQSIFAAAKTGDVEAVKKLTAPVFDKGTGAVTGQQSVLYHPSQHVSGYAQQAINEINYQLNPPKQFRFDGGHPLHSLNAAYPSHKGAPSSAAAQKLGKFIALGEPGVIALADLALPAKITHAEGGGTLSVHTYAKQAQAAIAKMPATQKQAVKSYTGNSYHAMNGSLWDGNPTGAAKAAGEALHTLGHDIEPGTILSRHLSLHGKDLNDILGSVGKVLQEPAIMSTSIRPSSWIRNVQFKLHVGPGVKGLWVGYNSLPGGEALSKNAGEDEMVLPPGTRLLVLSVRKGGKDADGFGAHGQQHVIEAIILPTE